MLNQEIFLRERQHKMEKTVIQNAFIFEEFKVTETTFWVKTPEEVDFAKGEMKIGHDIYFPENLSNQFLVTLRLILESKSDQKDAFKIDCTAIAKFRTQEPIDHAFKESSFIKLNAPAIAFPYLRSFISTLTSGSGFNPVVLPIINLSRQNKGNN